MNEKIWARIRADRLSVCPEMTTAEVAAAASAMVRHGRVDDVCRPLHSDPREVAALLGSEANEMKTLFGGRLYIIPLPRECALVWAQEEAWLAEGQFDYTVKFA